MDTKSDILVDDCNFNDVGVLESREVIDARLLVSGVGPNRPIGDNSTPDGRAMNRRVEIVLTPLTCGVNIPLHA